MLVKTDIVNVLRKRQPHSWTYLFRFRDSTWVESTSAMGSARELLSASDIRVSTASPP